MRLVWTRGALADLGSAYDYIVDESPSAASRLIERVEKTVLALTRHPEIGRAGRVAGTRELVVPGTPFILPYRIKGKKVELLAVLHASRRWPDQL